MHFEHKLTKLDNKLSYLFNLWKICRVVVRVVVSVMDSRPLQCTYSDNRLIYFLTHWSGPLILESEKPIQIDRSTYLSMGHTLPSVLHPTRVQHLSCLPFSPNWQSRDCEEMPHFSFNPGSLCALKLRFGDSASQSLLCWFTKQQPESA